MENWNVLAKIQNNLEQKCSSFWEPYLRFLIFEKNSITTLSSGLGDLKKAMLFIPSFLLKMCRYRMSGTQIYFLPYLLQQDFLVRKILASWLKLKNESRWKSCYMVFESRCKLTAPMLQAEPKLYVSLASQLNSYHHLCIQLSSAYKFLGGKPLSQS